MKSEREQSGFSQFVFLTADAALYAWLLYLFVKLRLLAAEGILPTTTWMFLPVLGAIALGWLYRKELKRRFAAAALLDIFIFLAAGQGAAAVAGMKVAKAQSFLWLPLEWTKLPAHAALMCRAFPLSAAAFWTVALLAILLAASKKKYAAALIAAAAAAITAFSIMGMEGESRATLYFVFVVPLVIAAVAAVANCPRAFSRLVLADGALLIVFFFYLGLIPFFPKSLNLPPGAERLYPPEGARAEFPMRFMRGFQLDEGRKALYTAYGPTSGVVRLDLETNELKILRHSGLIRALLTSGDATGLYALDWLNADLLDVDKKQFTLSRKTNLFDYVLIAPVDFAAAGGKMFVLSSDRPSLTSFDMETMKKERQIDFRRAGITAFRSGAWRMAADERTGKLFVMLGQTGPGEGFVILRIDPRDLRIERFAPLPEGGMELLALPEKRSVIAASFFSKNFYEVDIVTTRVRRVFPGVPTCRSMVYDEKRDLIIASSYTTGELAFIRYSTGEKIESFYIGKKPSSLAVSFAEDAVYFGSASGIFRAKLE